MIAAWFIFCSFLIPRFRCWEEDYFVYESGKCNRTPLPQVVCTGLWAFLIFFPFYSYAFWVILLAHSSSGRFINGNPLLWSEKLEGKQKADLMIKTLRNFILLAGYTRCNWSLCPPFFGLITIWKNIGGLPIIYPF